MFRFCVSLDSPVGIIVVCGNETDIQAVSFSQTKPQDELSNDIVEECKQQLIEYFQGIRRQFTIPCNPQGTPFQQQVWNACSTVGYGQTASYGSLAVDIHNPNAAIAVGQALKRNPIAIIIPCHRILNSQEKNTGYAGEPWRKDHLLLLEKQYSKNII